MIKKTIGLILSLLFLVSISFSAVDVDSVTKLAKSKYNVTDSEIKDIATKVLDKNPETINQANPVSVSEKKTESLNQSKIEPEIIERSVIEKNFPETLHQYGYNVFNTMALTFTPLTNVPVAGDYVLGPGDELNIYLWGNIQQSFAVNIDAEGNILLPKVGKINMANVTLDEAKTIINKKMQQYFANFTLDVTMGRLKTIEVFVLGEVDTPGKYNLNSLSTVLYALYASGGPTKIGTLRDLKLIRNNKIIKSIDLYRLLLFGNKSDDISLRSGDTIFISKISDVAAVMGAVKVPAIYELKGSTTLSDILNMAGEYTRNSYIKEITISRRDNKEDKFVLETVAFKTWNDFLLNSQKVMIYNGDIIEVKSISNVIDDYVDIKGPVKFPGRYPYNKSKDLKSIINIAGGYTEDTYTKRLNIYRINSDNQTEIVPVENMDDNITLKNKDIVEVYSIKDRYKKYNVSISGKVNKPGSFDFRNEMTVEDIIFLAGDFSSDADTKNIYIIRKTALTKDQPIKLDYKANHGFKIQPLDEVIIRGIRDYESLGMVELSGEIRFPGSYPIEETDTVLSMIQKAGGLTTESFIDGISLTRVMDSKLNLSALKQTESSAATDQQIANLGEFNRLRIDFKRLFKGDKSQNVIVKQGDRIDIPKIPQDIKVVGGVYNQGAFLYQDNMDMGLYLGKAGLFRKDADINETYIVHVDGTVTKTNDKNTRINRGDTIVVPTQEIEKINIMQTILDFTQILFNVATTWRVVFGL